MKRTLFVALSAAFVTLAVAITILGHCGSTWVVQEPTFGPQLTRSDCTTGGARTTTTKSVSTTIHWNVGPPLTVVVTDFGENKIISGFTTDDCKRCFPVFDARIPKPAELKFTFFFGHHAIPPIVINNCASGDVGNTFVTFT